MILVNNPFGMDPMDFDKETAADRVGNRIRKIRTSKGLSQAELGEMVGLNADRVQKYENGARKPKDELLKKIAVALDVSPLALVDPVPTSYVGAMYSMFEMEDNFNMKVGKAPADCPEGLCIYVDIEESMYHYMEEWYKVYTQKQYQLDAALTKEERDEINTSYKMWQWNFPKALIDKTDKAVAKARIQEQIDRLQQLKDEIDTF